MELTKQLKINYSKYTMDHKCSHNSQIITLEQDFNKKNIKKMILGMKFQ